MILVFVDKQTSRLRYIFNQLFCVNLGIDIEFTSSIEGFVSCGGMKMSYTDKPLGSELHFSCHRLLFEEDISYVEVLVEDYEGVPCFFHVGRLSAFPYDIFAASFYLLSRYEEYLPHQKDKHYRFLSSQSTPVKNGFAHLPIIDIWLDKVRKILENSFKCTFSKSTFSHQSVVNVDLAYAYLHRSVVRTIGGWLADLVNLNFNRIYESILCRLRLRSDPL